MVDVQESLPDGRRRQVLRRIARPPADHGRHRPDVGTGRLEQRRGDRHGLVSPSGQQKHDDVQSGDELSDELGHLLERHGRDRVERSVDVAAQRRERSVHRIHEKSQYGLRSDPWERPDAFGEQEEPELVAPTVGDHGRQRQRHRLCGLVTSILEVGFELVELGIEFVVISTLCVAQRYLEELVLRGAGGPRRCAGQPASSGVDRQRAEALEHEGDASHAEHVGVLPACGGRSHANGLTSLAKGLEGTPTHVGDLRRREDPLDGVLPQLVGPEPALCVLVQQGNRSHEPVDVDLRAGDGCHFAVRSRAEHGEGEQS